MAFIQRRYSKPNVIGKLAGHDPGPGDNDTFLTSRRSVSQTHNQTRPRILRRRLIAGASKCDPQTVFKLAVDGCHASVSAIFVSGSPVLLSPPAKYIGDVATLRCRRAAEARGCRGCAPSIIITPHECPIGRLHRSFVQRSRSGLSSCRDLDVGGRTRRSKANFVISSRQRHHPITSGVHTCTNSTVTNSTVFVHNLMVAVGDRGPGLSAGSKQADRRASRGLRRGAFCFACQ